MSYVMLAKFNWDPLYYIKKSPQEKALLVAIVQKIAKEEKRANRG